MSQPLPIGIKYKVVSGEFRGQVGITKPNTNNSTVAYLHVCDVDADSNWTLRKDKNGNDVIIGVPPGSIAEA